MIPQKTLGTIAPLFVLYLSFLASTPQSAIGDDSKFQLPKEVEIGTSVPSQSACYEYAASELGRLLERLGVETSIASKESRSERWQIRLGKPGSGQRPQAEQLKRLFADGFLLNVDSTGVIITSNSAKGILNGVYDLGERFGYLFLYPGEEGEWPPLDAFEDISISAGEFFVNPRFPHRGIFNGNSNELWATYYAKMRFNALCQPTEQSLADKLGLRIEVGNHDLDLMIPPRLFEETPDMFRMNQPEDFFGKRVGDFNLCVSSPLARTLIKEEYRKRIHELHKEGIYAWNTWPEDLPAEGWCFCPTCRSFKPNDQAMIATRMQAEVIREENLPMRVPFLAYHDTMFPGKKIDAPKEAFLLYAPRERCYGHALDDPTCGVNGEYLRSLKEWNEKLKDIDDAHTFEYYLDRVLFRGLFPFLPQVILDDMDTYEAERIESHICLQTGSGFEPRLMMLNMPVFAMGQWDADLDAAGFISMISDKISPGAPEVWVDYFTKRSEVSASTMRWEDDSVGWADYRWFTETTLPIGREMVSAYLQGSKDYTEAAKKLEDSISSDWSERVQAFAKTEILRTRFEAQELKVMSVQQDAMNHIGNYLNNSEVEKLEQGIGLLQETLAELVTSKELAIEAGNPPGTYYFMYNKWVKKEIGEKIERWKVVTESNLK